MNIQIRNRFVLALTLLALLTPVVSWAQAAPAAPAMSTVSTTPSVSLPSLAPGSGSGSLFGFIFYPLAPQDIGYNLLQRMFGPEVTTIANGGFLTASSSSSSSTSGTAANQASGAGSVLAAGFGVMNTGILMIVALMTIFGSLTGILHTANRGEWMGRNGSMFWAPVRVIIGAGSLMPVFGGYSLIQALVLWTTMAGMGVADRAASVMIDAFVSRPAVVAPTSPSGSSIAGALLAAQSCQSYYNNHAGAQIDRYNPATATADQWYVDQLTTTVAGGATTQQLIAPGGSVIWTHSITTGSTTDETQIQWVHLKDPQNWKAMSVPTSAVVCGGLGYRVPLNLPSHGLTNGLLGEVNNPASEREVQNIMFGAESRGVQAAAADTAPLAGLLATGRAPISSRTGGLVIPSPAYKAGPTPPPQVGAGGAVVPQTPPPTIPAPTAAQVSAAEATYAQAAQAFDAPVDQASSGALRMLVGRANLQQITTIVQQEGWLTIGGLWLNLARMDESDHNLASPHTATQAPPLTGLAASSRGAQVIKQALAIGAHPTTALGRLISPSGTSTANQPWYDRWASDGEHDVSDVVSRVLMVPVEAILYVFVGSSGGWGNAGQTINSAAHALSDGNPLIMFMEAGQLMLTVAGWLILTWLVLKVLGGVLAKGVSLLAAAAAPETGGASEIVPRSAGMVFKSILAKFLSLTLMLILAFLLGGFFLAIYLPALPLIAFLSAAMGWMLMVAETMMAAPLWAAAHVSFEGEGWAPQRAQMGYQMVAGLVLRPIMITIGAFLAMALMEASAWLIGISFLGYASAYINGTQSVTQALEANGLVIVLVGMLIYVCHMSVRVITVLPDQVMKWIGGGQDALGAAPDMQKHAGWIMGAVSLPGRSPSKGASSGTATGGNKEAGPSAASDA
jgi:conjugal transfer/type IV secretion protein DotA/TraY